MRQPFAPLRMGLAAFVPLVALLLLFGPAPATGDVPVNLSSTSAVTNANWGTWSNTGRLYSTNASWTSIAKGTSVPAVGYRAVGSKFTGISAGATTRTYTEQKTGYINQIRYYVDYRLNANPFVDDRIEASYSTDIGVTWKPNFLDPDRPVVDATAVSATATKKTNTYGGTPGKPLPDITGVDTWAKVKSNLQLRCDWLGYNGATKTSALADVDNTTFYIDGLYLKILPKLTVIGADVAPAALNPQGMTQIPRLRLNTKRFSDTNMGLNAIKFNLTGTVDRTDIALVSLYLDATSNGTFTKNSETFVTSTTVTGTVGSLTGTLSGAPLVAAIGNGTTRYYFLTVDFADDAVVGRTCGMTIVDESYITPKTAVDKVASNADQLRAGCIRGTDPLPLFPIATTTVATVAQKAAPSLAFTVPAAPDAFAVGVNFNVTVSVTNAAGANTATNVLPGTPVVTSPDGGMAVTTTVPVAATLAGGASTTFTWVFKGTSPGTITITSAATCADQTTLKTITSAPASSPLVTITASPCPVLVFTGFSVAPLCASNDGQAFNVQIAIKNLGSVAANATALYPIGGTTAQVWLLSNSGTGSASATTSPSVAQIIPADGTVRWNYVYSAGPAAGTLTLGCEARGNNFATATGTGNTITICAQALVQNVSNVTSIAPAIGTNTSFTLTNIVKNNGGTIATLLVPPAPSLTVVAAGSPNPSKTSGPTPASYATLAPGATAQFDYVYNSQGGTTPNGQYKIGVSTGYKDAGSLLARNSGTLECATFTVVNMVTPATISANRNGPVRKAITYSDNSDYYVIDETGLLTAFNPNAGHTVKWTYDFMAGALTSPEAVSGTMITCSTEPAGPVIWVGTNDGRVFAILDGGASAAGFVDADPELSFIPLGDTDPILTGPVVWGQYLYAATGSMVCKRDKATGDIPSLWTDYAAPGGAIVTTAPAVDNNYIYFGCDDGKLYCISAATGAYVSATASFGAAITASPFVNGANKIYSANADGILFRVNHPTNLANVTQVDLDGAGAHGVLSDLWLGVNGFLWVTDTAGGNLYKCSQSTLGVQLMKNYPGRTLSSVIEWKTVIYFSASVGGRGEFYAVKKADLTNQTTLWPYQIGTAGSGSLCPVTVDVWMSMFVTGADNKKVYFFGLPVP